MTCLPINANHLTCNFLSALLDINFCVYIKHTCLGDQIFMQYVVAVEEQVPSHGNDQPGQ